MFYIRLDQIEFSIGTQVLLDKVNLTLDKVMTGITGPQWRRQVDLEVFCRANRTSRTEIAG